MTILRPSFSTGLLVLAACIATALAAWGPAKAADAPGPANEPAAHFDAEGRLLPPTDYREWIHLTSGFDMSYNPTMGMGHHMLDNVYVDPASYRAFLRTGTWPDRTVLVLEGREAVQKGSINQSGYYQSGPVMGLEAHVRDDARFPGRWAFYAFDGSKPVRPLPSTAACYECHAKHGAVDTTFVQFYPTLLPVAEGAKTLQAAYLASKARH